MLEKKDTCLLLKMHMMLRQHKVILIILLVVFSIIGDGEFTYNKKNKISNLYNLSIIEYKASNKDKTFNNLKEIVLEKDPTYSPLSLYFIIDKDLINDKNKINDLFDILINKTSLEDLGIFVIEESGYLKMLENEKNKLKKIENESRADNWKELVNAL